MNDIEAAEAERMIAAGQLTLEEVARRRGPSRPLARRLLAALLTNCNGVHWDRVETSREHVHAAFSSHILGVVEPDTSIFHPVANALEVEPGAVWLFDDLLVNVKAARPH